VITLRRQPFGDDRDVSLPAKPTRPKLSVTEYFGTELKRRRMALNMSQAAVAYAAGISQTKIPAIEAGRVNVHIRTAADLAKAVGANLKDLLPD